MSASGEILDALKTLAEAAVSGLSAERGLRFAGDLEDEDYPHLFLYNPVPSEERLDYQQVQTRTRVSASLVTHEETQEATLLKVDAIQAAIAADPTLGGVVDDAYLPERPMEEDPREQDRIVSMIIETSEVS